MNRAAWFVPVFFLLLLGLGNTIPPSEPPSPTPVAPVRSMSPFASDVRVTVTHYWPPNGGPNCYLQGLDWCMSPTASGLPWEVAVGLGGQAAACPPEWPMFSLVVLEPGQRTLICLDRGGAVRCTDRVCGIDVLTWDARWDGQYTATVYAPFWRIYGWTAAELKQMRGEADDLR